MTNLNLFQVERRGEGALFYAFWDNLLSVHLSPRGKFHCKSIQSQSEGLCFYPCHYRITISHPQA